jgi:hypothetical protein
MIIGYTGEDCASTRMYIVFTFLYIKLFLSYCNFHMCTSQCPHTLQMLTTLLVTRQIVAIASAVIKPRATSWLKARFLARKLQKQSLLKTGKGCKEAVCRRQEQSTDSINKQAIIQQMNTEVSSSTSIIVHAL